MTRLMGPQQRRAYGVMPAEHVISRTPQTCVRCRRTIPAGVRHVREALSPSWEFAGDRGWTTEHLHGESPTSCPIQGSYR